MYGRWIPDSDNALSVIRKCFNMLSVFLVYKSIRNKIVRSPPFSELLFMECARSTEQNSFYILCSQIKSILDVVG